MTSRAEARWFPAVSAPAAAVRPAAIRSGCTPVMDRNGVEGAAAHGQAFRQAVGRCFSTMVPRSQSSSSASRNPALFRRKTAAAQLRLRAMAMRLHDQPPRGRNPPPWRRRAPARCAGNQGRRRRAGGSREYCRRPRTAPRARPLMRGYWLAKWSAQAKCVVARRPSRSAGGPAREAPRHSLHDPRAARAGRGDRIDQRGGGNSSGSRQLSTTTTSAVRVISSEAVVITENPDVVVARVAPSDEHTCSENRGAPAPRQYASRNTAHGTGQVKCADPVEGNNGNSGNMHGGGNANKLKRCDPILSKN